MSPTNGLFKAIQCLLVVDYLSIAPAQTMRKVLIFFKLTLNNEDVGLLCS